MRSGFYSICLLYWRFQSVGADATDNHSEEDMIDIVLFYLAIGYSIPLFIIQILIIGWVCKHRKTVLERAVGHKKAVQDYLTSLTNESVMEQIKSERPNMASIRAAAAAAAVSKRKDVSVRSTTAVGDVQDKEKKNLSQLQCVTAELPQDETGTVTGTEKETKNAKKSEEKATNLAALVEGESIRLPRAPCGNQWDKLKLMEKMLNFDSDESDEDNSKKKKKTKDASITESRKVLSVRHKATATGQESRKSRKQIRASNEKKDEPTKTQET